MFERSCRGGKNSGWHGSLLIFALHFVLFAAGNTAALSQQPTPDLEMGARLVEARCVFCHKQNSLPDLVDRCTNEHGEGYLDQFLKRHHAPDDEARGNIIAYLTCPPNLLPSE